MSRKGWRNEEMNHESDGAGVGNLSERGRRILSGMQSQMTLQAEKRTPIPAHFRTNRRGSRVTVTNTRTDREVTVALCDYDGFRLALNTFCRVLDG